MSDLPIGEMTCYLLRLPSRKRQPPKWLRTIGVDDKGALYVPAVVSGRSEQEVMLCANYDGIPIAVLEKHLFVPADWLKREFPLCAPGVAKLEANMRALDILPQPPNPA